MEFGPVDGDCVCGGAGTKALRREVHDLKEEKAKLESAKVDAERELQRDYGKDGQFFKLKGECVEAQVQK
jgi:hypothetical protein